MLIYGSEENAILKIKSSSNALHIDFHVGNQYHYFSNHCVNKLFSLFFSEVFFTILDVIMNPLVPWIKKGLLQRWIESCLMCQKESCDECVRSPITHMVDFCVLSLNHRYSPSDRTARFLSHIPGMPRC